MCILAVLQRIRKTTAADVVELSMLIMRSMHKRQILQQQAATVDLVAPLLCAGVVAVWAFDTDLELMKDILPLLSGAEADELHQPALQVLAAVLLLAKSGRTPFRLAANDVEAILTATLDWHFEQAKPEMDETVSRIFALSDKGATDL